MQKKSNLYKDFIESFQLFVSKNPKLIINTLSNIFSMRIIGNKTHGDLAEIGISEFINQFIYDYKSMHVGKDLFRSKEHEEDIVITCLKGYAKGESIPISLKAYGVGPLQLSTDKEFILFRFLASKVGNGYLNNKNEIDKILCSEEFEVIKELNVLPMIYNEKEYKCNMMVFDPAKAFEAVTRIDLVQARQKFDENKGEIIEDKNKKCRVYPIYRFSDRQNKYLFEVRYGGANANALQRGVWTHTVNCDSKFFTSITNGWIDYSENRDLVKLISLALVSTQKAHQDASIILQNDIDVQKLPE